MDKAIGGRGNDANKIPPIWLKPIKGYSIPFRDTDSFVLYADCDVQYDGRANSKLARGKYLIIHKADGSILIHAADQVPPRNYQSSGSKLECIENQLISKNRKESLIITVYEIVYNIDLNNWSTDKLSIIKTERELKEKLLHNWSSYISGNFIEFRIEHIIDVGVVDLLGIADNGVYHIVEAKRGTAVIGDCSQLRRYLEYYINIGKVVVGYIASPKISRNAMKHLNDNNCKWLEIAFDS